MDLVFATEEFVLNRVSYPGFPILLNAQMEVVEEAHLFLVHECLKRGRVRSPRSWAAYGQAMYDYFGFLEANGLAWRSYSDNRNHTPLAAYRDWSLGELGLAASTVNARLRVITRFYRYAASMGWITSVPYDIESVQVRQAKGFLAHTDPTGAQRASPDVILKQHPTEVRLLSKSQIQQFLSAITGPTQMLIARLALQTGLRKEELATFPVRYVVDPSHYDERSAIVRVNMRPEDMKTKGDKPRAIDVPRRLMADLSKYIKHERAVLQEISGERQTELFLNRNGQPWAGGGRTLNNLWARLDLGFKVTPHILRHTFATHTLYDLRQRRVSVDPLMYVRDRLGHSSIKTTERYLHYLSEVEDDLMTHFQEEVDALSQG